MANNFNLSVDGNDIETLLEVPPEGFMSVELLELEQECIAEEEARQQETAREEKDEHQKNLHEGFSRSFYRPQWAS